MKCILSAFHICILAFFVKSETHNFEYDKIRDLVREEIQNFHNLKIFELESKVITMNEHINRQDVQIQNQEKRIKEQQMYIRGQEIHIRKHNRQINELSEHIYKQEGVAMNNKSQIPSVSIVKDSFLTQAEPGESVNHFNHSFRGNALRRSIKAIPGKKKPP
ncbi:unnamed protein product [Mytilus edulis]|uniref:Secreted protein n=1 Tax=Mytilus edulis TaxID=6550 RepID=A0A8S3QYF7_MYTED|nr:unnamed protein product [Mytilus edulis]